MALSTADLIQPEYGQKPSSWDVLYTSLENFLCTTLAIHTRHGHEPSKTNIFWVLFQYTEMSYGFQYVFHYGESRIPRGFY